MRLTTKGRFAVTAMIDLGLRSTNGPVALAAISARQQISLSYLEQLFGKLRRAELVESTRGPGGGYSLGRSAAAITVADIIVAVDEPIDATGCAGRENCMGEDSGKCMTHDLWAALNARMIEFLSSVTLKEAGRRADRQGRVGGRATGQARHFVGAGGQADPRYRAKFGVRTRRRRAGQIIRATVENQDIPSQPWT